MYKLPHAGIIVKKLLEESLVKNRYRTCELTPGLWNHETISVTFCLTFIEFGVKYIGKEHLVDAFQHYYQIFIDWEGNLYCGLSLDCAYNKITMNIYMPGCVKNDK